MIINELKAYLDNASAQSKFKVHIEDTGGYITFTNSSGKYFTLSLISIRQMLQDILKNLSVFSAHELYDEKEWRNLSQYYSDATIQSLSTVQTKPLFVTLNKLIHWANSIDIENENKINLSKDVIKNTLDALDKLIAFFTPKIEIDATKKIFSTTSLGNLGFEYKNILFKGVPGTGKSRAIDNIIEKNLKLKDKKKNILRINIHSASSNADLMQGIGISSDKGNIVYGEKQGLIFDLIKKAVFHPHQPFVLILEEIQENSLNELIGDLIYLIEDEKRANLKDMADDEEYAYQELIEKVVKEDADIHYVEIPFLVSSSTEYRKMILPDNLYVFCTSNYRDDKKIIEDNLLRRFEVIEIYPDKDVAHEYARGFFDSLNASIRKAFETEIHPDRYMIGHATWKDVDSEEKFYRAFLKMVTEFKDIREIEFETFSDICTDILMPDGIELDMSKYESYYDLIDMLQKKIGYGFTA